MRSKTRLFFSFSLALMFAVVLFSNQQAFGQQTSGNLRGSVVDQNGELVPGATVVAKNMSTGVESPSATTGSSGTFAITNLLPGPYSVSVRTSSGFKSKTVTDVIVRLGLDTEVKVQLEIGTAEETVTVTSSTEEIAQSNSQISTNFDSQKVQDLPSNAAGGGIDTLALSVPGVTPGFGNVNSNGTTLSVNGNRARSNNFTINGTDNNDLSIGGPSFFISNQALVGEFQIITNNFSAEYGRNQGAIVNIVTKAGTNSIRGETFLYHRNAGALDAMTNLEARDPNRGSRDKFVSNVFGGVVGGPIVKNKLFFLGSTQIIRQRQTTTAFSGNIAILPSEFARLTAAFPGNPVIQALVKQGAFGLSNFGSVSQRTDSATFAQDRVCISLTPATNCIAANQTGFYAVGFPQRQFGLPFDQEEYTARADWNISDKDNVTFNYLFQDNVSGNGLGGSNGFTGDIPARSWNLSGFWNRHVSSRMVNNFQATAQRLSLKFGGGCSDPLTGCIPDPSLIGESFTQIQFAGLRGDRSGATIQTIGQGTNLPQGRIVDVYQFTDKVSMVLNNHTIRFGADIRYLTNTVPFLPNLNGLFRYNTVASVLSNIPTSVTLAAGEDTLSYKQYDQFYFIQDDWKVLPNLTLNLGVRYEYSGQPINLLNTLTTARESSPTTALYLQSLPVEARSVPAIPADSNNIAPRLGFAWSPNFGDSKILKALFGGPDDTVIRGGFSMAYDPVFYNIMLNMSTSAPVVFLDTITTSATLNAPALPGNPIGSAVRTVASPFLRRNTFDPRLLSQTQVSADFHSPHSKQFSFGLQRQINQSNVIEMRYVGNRGNSLFQSVNRNPAYAGIYNGFSTTVSGTTYNFPNFRNLIPSAPAPAANGRLLGDRGLIRSRENTGSSKYDSLQFRYNGRSLNKNLNFGASYTYSNALDNASEIFAFGENAIAQDPFNLQDGEWSFSGFDRRHSFSFNFIYDIPFKRDQQGFVGKVLGGWQLNGTFNLANGRPFTPEQTRAVSTGRTYSDFTFDATFFGLDSSRPFLGNPNVDVRRVAITVIDAIMFGFVPVGTTNTTGFFLLNDLNRRDAAGNRILTSVTPNDVRFILNGPGAAVSFGTPFGDVKRNSVYGPILNQLNMSLFKTTNISERVKIQIRAEAFNVLNRPNAGFGVAGGSSLPGSLLQENAGLGFADHREASLSSRRIQFGLRIIF